MVYHIYGNLNNNTIEDFVEFLNNIDNTKPLIVYLNSGGGYCWVKEQLQHIIESYEGYITLVASHIIGSSAFDLFFSSKVDKEILPDTCGMSHQMTWSVDMNTSLQPSDAYESFKIKSLKDSNSIESINQLVNFNKTELKDIKAGKDLWISYKRLLQMLQYNKKALK